MSEPKNEYKLTRKCKYFCIASFFVFFGSLVVQMHVSNSTALKGKDFRHFHQKKEIIEREIALLKFEDSNLSSLGNIEKRAKELGFVIMTEPLSPIVPPSLASLNTN